MWGVTTGAFNHSKRKLPPTTYFDIKMNCPKLLKYDCCNFLNLCYFGNKYLALNSHKPKINEIKYILWLIV